MADHLTRKELKQDNVALRVEESFQFASAHRQQIIRIGGGVLALAAIVAAIFYYRSYEHGVREQLLGDAISLQNAPVGSASPTGGPTFATEAAKKDAIVKAYTRLVTEHSGSEEAYIGEYWLAGLDSEAGRAAESRRKYQDVADHANANYASLAKLALAQMDFGENKVADARALLTDLIAHPTDLVSKDEATVVLARGIAATQPEEARKLLLPIAERGGETAQIAVSTLGDLPKK